MKIGFFGTPDFARGVLRSLCSANGFEVVFAVSNPDAPVGRSGAAKECAVKAFARERGIPTFTPEKVRGNVEFLETAKGFGADCFVVAAYGKILPRELLEIPRLGCVNVHGSVLPEYRGASPIQAAIADGRTKTGVTIMKMSEGMDEGDVLATLRFPIRETDTAGSMFERFSEVSGPFLVETLRKYGRGGITPVPQDASKATYCGKISKESGKADWARNAEKCVLEWRAHSPWPGTYAFWNGKRLVLEEIAAVPESDCFAGIPTGRVFKLATDVCVRCGNGALILRALKIEWRPRQAIRDFMNGHPDFMGSDLT